MPGTLSELRTQYNLIEVTNKNKMHMPRIETLKPDSKLKSERRLQELNNEKGIISIDDEIQIDGSDEQPSRADSPTLKPRRPGWPNRKIRTRKAVKGRGTKREKARIRFEFQS
jgi:hypothetical protein